MNPFPTDAEIARGDYPRWEDNSPFEKDCLRALGLPEDFHPDEEQARLIVIWALEDFT